jgi:LDH2 family malate/lactate/ureidoglycolate dehydrogenase
MARDEEMMVAPTETTPHLVRPEKLRALVARLFSAAGVPDADAETVAEVLVEADLRGVESHGTTRVAGYLSMIRLGLLNPKPTVQVLRDTPSTAMLEGDRAFGIVVARRSMETAIDKASRVGIAAVTARNITHTGLVGFYPMLAARQGLIGLAMNNGPKILPPFGGRTPTLATNPFSAAFPAANEEPIVLDMATSIVAGGKLRLAAKKGLAIPAQWALDRHGEPTTDPNEAIYHGFLQWAGGYKGFGMATVVEVLAGVLSGGLFGADVPPMKTFGKEPLITSAFYMAVNVEHFMPLREFAERVDRLVRHIKASEPARGVEEVFVAGEIEHRTKGRRLREGIPLTGVVYRELEGLASQYRVGFDL